MGEQKALLEISESMTSVFDVIKRAYSIIIDNQKELRLDNIDQVKDEIYKMKEDKDEVLDFFANMDNEEEEIKNQPMLLMNSFSNHHQKTNKFELAKPELN